LQLSVIIVNYNVKYFTEQCLYSVVKACKNLEAEIIVVDNNSTDDSYTFFINKFANVHFIWNKENIGFSKANNIGLRQATGRYILFLNPDTIVAEDCFEKCLDFYCAQNNIGAMGIRMIDGEGNFLRESKRSFPSISTSFFKLSGLTMLFPRSRIFARYYLGNMPNNINQQVPVLSGAFMMVEKKLLDVIGGFDETFFMYGEDIDLSYRIERAGFKNYYFSETTIVHFKGESTKKDNLQYVRLFYGAMDLFVQKHYSGIKSVLYRLFIHSALGLKTINTVFTGIFFTKQKKPKNRTGNPLPVLLVGYQKDCESLAILLKNTTEQLQILGIVDTAHTPGNNTLGSVQRLPELINKHAIKTIIFCVNDFPVKEVISIIQGMHLQVSYQFYRVGSCSIVGSSNNKKAGNWVALF
jgi:GT2 family glycosyltransferase